MADLSEQDVDLLDALPLQLRQLYIYPLLAAREWTELRLVNKLHAKLWQASRSALHLNLSHPACASALAAGAGVDVADERGTRSFILSHFPQLRQVPVLELPSSASGAGQGLSDDAAAELLTSLPVCEQQRALTLR